jgi:hypothetical protein
MAKPTIKKDHMKQIKNKVVQLKKEIVYNKSIKTRVADERLMYTDRTHRSREFLNLQDEDMTSTLNETLKIDNNPQDTLNLTYRSHGINSEFDLIQVASKLEETVLTRPGFEDMVKIDETFLME